MLTQRLAMLIALAFSLCFSHSAHADAIVGVNLFGWKTENLKGGAGNTVQIIDVEANATIENIAWNDVVYAAYGPSLRNHVAFSFSNSDQSSSWDFSLTNLASPGNYVGSGGVSDMVGVTGGPFQLLSDGKLRIEVYERVADNEFGPESLFTRGSFTVTTASSVSVPEPTSLLVLAPALGLIGLRRRRAA